MALGGCASTKSRPAWVDDVKASCSAEKEICATGQGISRRQAEADARNEIMKFFKTSIKSNYTSFEKADLNSDKIEGSASNRIWTGTDGVLEGVVIKDNYEQVNKDSGVSDWYSLASFDKAVAITKVNKKIDELDDKMATLITSDNKKAIRELSEAFNDRKELNYTKIFLTNVSKPEVVSFKQIDDLKKARVKNGYNATLDSSAVSGNFGRFLNNQLRNSLTAIGVRLGNGAQFNKNKIISEFVAQQEHLNVKGWVKYTFTFTATLQENGDDVNTIVVSATETGRSEAQAFERVRDQMKKEIDARIYELI